MSFSEPVSQSMPGTKISVAMTRDRDAGRNEVCKYFRKFTIIMHGCILLFTERIRIVPFSLAVLLPNQIADVKFSN